eukprot:TRINITY_DN1251_c0_g2_i2.p1 TRINITY_DN1251_c0_g2~~TRINITY_DN1251_c0_g2_i2.p1  ORF type:complete len:521 (+),score=103.93 TRINITY_DN1251_c0_g2_i2:426-1988(+)
MDFGVTPELVSRMKPFQKINHFPDMSPLYKKNLLARNLSKMQRGFGEEYGFFPQTWTLPGDWNWLKVRMGAEEGKTYIVKPEGSSQGRGIFLTKNIEEINPMEHCVVQEYIEDAYLIEGLKFDLRVYVLVYGCDPLRIYVFREGLARFSTEDYVKPTKQNIQNQYMHLTNYAINKHSEKFVFNFDADDPTVGHKRSLAFVWSYIDKHRGDSTLLRSNINDIIVKTLCAVQPQLSRSFRGCQPANVNNNMCFEILGFDILVDEKCKPWLLEVNHAPSFGTDTPFDNRVKTRLIADTVTLINLTPESRKKCLEKEKERQSARIYGRASYTTTKEEKEVIRKAAMQERDSYETEHCGGFARIYPDSSVQHRHKAYLAYAEAMSTQFFGLRGGFTNVRVPPIARSLGQKHRPKSPLGKEQAYKGAAVKTRLQDIAQMKLNAISSIYKTKMSTLKTNTNSRVLLAAKDYLPTVKRTTVNNFHKKGMQRTNTSKDIIFCSARYYDINKYTKRDSKETLSTRQALNE